MAKRFISQLVENERVNEVFLLTDKQLRQNRNGNLYLQMRLGDRSGELTAMLWNANEGTASDVQAGDYVRIDGATQLFNGTLQMIATKIQRIADDSIDEADFVRATDINVQQLQTELTRQLQSITTPMLTELCECFLADTALMDRYCRAPAAVRNHHAYVGGLLEHVVSIMQLADLVAAHYRQLNRDLLLLGAFLHDIGKIDELSYDREFAYTDEGQMVGHLVQGVAILDRKIGEAEQMAGREFPPEFAVQLKHMIVSHHGKYEFGSPKLPMTLEAVALNYLDDLDAKMHWITHVIHEDANFDSVWTPFHAQLGRKLYKGRSTESPGG